MRDKEGVAPPGDSNKQIMLIALTDLNAASGMVYWGVEREVKRGQWVHFSDDQILRWKAGGGGGFGILLELEASNSWCK
jgi:hypothetical protein